MVMHDNRNMHPRYCFVCDDIHHDVQCPYGGVAHSPEYDPTFKELGDKIKDEQTKTDSVGKNEADTWLVVKSWNAAIEAAAELFDKQASNTEDSFYAADCEDAAEQIRKLKK